MAIDKEVIEQAKRCDLVALAMMGMLIMHNMTRIHDYLENEFVPLQKAQAAIDDRRPAK